MTLNIGKYYQAAKPNVEGPYTYYGKFICATSDEYENNLVGLFIEYVWIPGINEEIWRRSTKKEVAVSFMPTSSEGLVFWVNAKTEGDVREIIDAAMETLQQGFHDKGLEVIIGEPALSRS